MDQSKVWVLMAADCDRSVHVYAAYTSEPPAWFIDELNEANANLEEFWVEETGLKYCDALTVEVP